MDCGKAFIALTIGCAGLLQGCGQSATGTGSGPEKVIAEFLEGVRTGDEAKASQLLTPLARQKTAEMEIVVAPPGSETARYEIREVKMIEGGASVATTWTDLDTDGRPHTDLIVWLLREEPKEGWRIRGMTARVFEDQEPIVLNFENPAEMLAKQQQTEEEIARREQRGQLPGENQRSAAGAVR